jgi:7 transmembrane sweet-taste receptor of 3 GCPR
MLKARLLDVIVANLCSVNFLRQVLQFTRRKISASAVAGPLVAMLFATVVILTAWTVHDPLAWTRTEANEVTGESFGQCDSDSMQLYVPILGVVMAIPTVLTCVMAWKTKDVDQSFTESSWIFTLIILQLQVIMVSIPIAIILRGTSTAGRYIGVVLLIFSFPATTVAFIMGPKFVAYSQSQFGSSSLDSSRRSRGFSQGRVLVSGISRVSGATNSQDRQTNSELASAFVDRDGTRKVSFLDDKNSQGDNEYAHTS